MNPISCASTPSIPSPNRVARSLRLPCHPDLAAGPQRSAPSLRRRSASGRHRSSSSMTTRPTPTRWRDDRHLRSRCGTVSSPVVACDYSMTDELARDPKDVVRDGYDAISEIYRADDAEDGSQGEWLAEFARALPPGGHVLDLGCGCGVPAARWLSARGFTVTGVDISARQIERARALVPGAEFIQSDMAAISFDDSTFDAVVSLYALIHLPVAEQPGVLSRIARWLRPGGPLLAIVGAGPGTGTEENWLGGGAQMYWSQPSLPTTLEWVQQAGLLLDWQRFIPEGGTGHVLIHARCRSPRDK